MAFKRTKAFFNRVGNKIASESKQAIGYNQIRDNHNELKGMWADIKGSVKKRQGRNETFQEAKTRLNVSSKDIEATRNNYALMSYLGLILTGFSFFSVIYLAFVGAKLSAIALPAVLGLYGLASTFRYSFWCFQIKNRNLCSISDFVASGEFFPKASLRPIFRKIEEIK